ncbi:MAG TPA: DUF2207 domain-containing protein [Terriglobales bacterium]|nr:DUF2207 domain-containing protein [Terriglobales bacterium]
MSWKSPVAGRRSRFPSGLALLLLVLAASLPAAARSWRIANFSSQVLVDEDSSAVITERITLVFVGHWNGIYRDIPVDYPGPGGSNYKLLLKVTRVVDGEGHPLEYESRVEDGYRKLKIYVPDADDTTRTVEITYHVSNGIRHFEDHDEFYWNVTGNDWPVPIDHASAFVIFPAQAAGSLRAQAFTGAYGDTSHEATATVNGANAQFETTSPLPLRGGLTIDVYVPPGILRAPGILTRIGWFLAGNSIVLLPLAALAVMFPLWWYKGRDPDPGISVAPIYEPPANMTPAEMGTLIDDSVDPRDITSTLVDLAVRGYVRIEEIKDEGMLSLFHSKDYVFHLLKPMTQWQELAPHERVMLENVFAGGQQTKLSDLRNKFYTAIPILKHDILHALKNKGMYRTDPDAAQKYRLGSIALIVVLFVVLHWMGLMSVFDSGLTGFVAVAAAGLVVYLFGRKMTCKTFYGVRTFTAVRGFQEFMQRVDADRLKRMPPDTFEKYLPFAMALGVEHQWAHAFEGIVKDPPNWYQSSGGGMFSPWMFTNGLTSMTSQAQSAFVSVPRASSSGSGFSSGGGFSGGGFSGGGFGGGGGGAF